jgi:lipopolysaccharide exporter
LKPFTFNSKQFKTKNFKGVVSLLAGNTISKIILTLGGIFLAKLYGPENYGVYSVFLSYIMILPTLSMLQLDNIMILQRGTKEIKNMFNGIILISGIISLIISLIVIILKYYNILNVELPIYILMLCSVGGILTSWNLTQNSLFTKYKFFKQISTAFILASACSVLFQSIFYLLGWKENGLIFGWIVGLLSSFIYNLNVTKNRWKKVDFKEFKNAVYSHKKILTFHYPSVAINTIANNILPLLILSYFTKLDVGVYLLAFKIISTPLLLLATSISKVYFQKSVTLFHHNKKALRSLTYRVAGTSFLIITAYVLLLNTIGIFILEQFFGKAEWVGLREMLLILSLWIIARSAINPIATLMVTINRNEYSMIFNIYLLIVNVIAILVGAHFNSFLYCIYIFVFFSSLGYFIQLGVLMWDLNKIVKNEA